MSIRFACPVCKTTYTVEDADVGKKSECRVCGQRLQVPAPPRPRPAKTRLGEIIGDDAPNRTADAQPSAALVPPPLPRRITRREWRVDVRDGAAPVDVSADELAAMAADGRLRRRDFVQPADGVRWRRAGRIRGLFPTPTPTAEQASLLTTCGACCGPIAKEAPACPKCGAPNGWLHAEVLRFLNRQARFAQRYTGFEAEGKGYMLVCRSVRPKQFLDYAANAVGGMGFFGPLSLSGLAVTLGASIGSQYAAKALRDAAGPGAHAFVINFRHDPPVWSATDPDVWEDVLDFFDVV